MKQKPAQNKETTEETTTKTSIPRIISLGLLGMFFLFGGTNHFLQPEIYLRIMPPFLPGHLELVYLSGIFEILGGIGVFLPRTRIAAGWGLVLLLFAVFPANIYMLMEGIYFEGMPEKEWLLWIRLPLQGVLIAWVWWATRLNLSRKG